MKEYKDVRFYGLSEGVTYDFVNEYESRVNPNMIHITNTFDFHTYFRYFLQRVMSLFIIEGMKDRDQLDYFLTALIVRGNVGFCKTKSFGVIPQHGVPSGIGLYYQPTSYLVTNPNFKSSDPTEYTIGDTCEVVRLTPDWCGIADIISSYAQRVAMILSDADVAGALAKFGYIITAKNKASAETFKRTFDSIMSGQLAVAINQSLYDSTTGKPLFDYINNDVEKNFNVVIKALDSVERLKTLFDKEIGLYAPPEKKANLITDEVELAQNGVMSKCELWLDCINAGFDRVKQTLGLDLYARLRYPRKGGVENGSSDSGGDTL